MGSLKNTDKLIDKIDEELSWRKLELTQLKFLVNNSSPDEELTILRSSIVLLYAHWEGFVKNTLTLYLKHIADQQLCSHDLKLNFYAIGLLCDYENFKKTKKISHCIEITKMIFSKVDEIPNIKYNEIIDTKSNLNSELFKDLLELLCLDPSIHDTSFNLIDERLLARRNGIAHGENRKRFQLDKDEYNEIHERIIQIFDGLAEQIKDASVNESYKNKCPYNGQAYKSVDKEEVCVVT